VHLTMRTQTVHPNPRAVCQLTSVHARS
jgi:hypothetical protein